MNVCRTFSVLNGLNKSKVDEKISEVINVYEDLPYQRWIKYDNKGVLV